MAENKKQTPVCLTQPRRNVIVILPCRLLVGIVLANFFALSDSLQTSFWGGVWGSSSTNRAVKHNGAPLAYRVPATPEDLDGARCGQRTRVVNVPPSVSSLCRLLTWWLDCRTTLGVNRTKTLPSGVFEGF